MGSSSKADIRYGRNPDVVRFIETAKAALRCAEHALRMATLRALDKTGRSRARAA
jgi:hypothetical protein